MPSKRLCEGNLIVSPVYVCSVDNIHNNMSSLQFELPPIQPITVSIGVDIKDIPKVSDTDFAITLNAYFIVKWHDSRLIVEG